MKSVIIYGTFELLHYGHINLLRWAKALGDYLIVAISSDEFNWDEKHKKTYMMLMILRHHMMTLIQIQDYKAILM